MVAGFAHAPVTKGAPRDRSRADAVAIVCTALSSLFVSLFDFKPYVPFQFHPHIATYHQVRRSYRLTASFGRLPCIMWFF